MTTDGWRKRQVLQKITAYESRTVGVRSGDLKQIFKPAWVCTKCGEVFFQKENAEHHTNIHRDSNNKEGEK